MRAVLQMIGSLEIELSGERVCLWPERAMSRRRTLFIADPHFGKAAAFRAFGIAAPDGTAADLQRLDRLLTAINANHLVVLGDFFHARSGCSEATLAALTAWRGGHRGLEITLVRGNHDRASGDPPRELEIQCVAEPWILGAFACCHEPINDAGGHVLAGHLHPAVVLREKNGARLRMPCFVVGPRRTILPAFGGFTGAKSLNPASGDRLFAVTSDCVIELPTEGGDGGGNLGLQSCP